MLSKIREAARSTDLARLGSVSLDSVTRTSSMAARGIKNYALRKPFCISFEVTRRCNARCQHCHLGGPLPDERRAPPERFAEIARALKPVVAQVSGGEPLLRNDVEEIVRGLANPNRAPYLVLTTNAALLTPDRYHRLIEAGVREYSVSFDFPDERHDEFRRIPGLWNKIQKLVSEVAATGKCAITFNSVVQRGNFRELPRMAQVATDLGVGINFSAYTWLRTGNRDMALEESDFPAFREVIAQLLEHKRRHGNVYTSAYVFEQMIEFFRTRNVNHCRAGERFLVVNPDGSFSPCGLIIRDYDSQQAVVADFTGQNTCGECYTSLRANTEKPLQHLLSDAIRPLLR